jgi:hypothetical protein
VEQHCSWLLAAAAVLEIMRIMAMEIRVQVDLQVVLVVAVRVDQAVEVMALVEVIQAMPAVELAGAQMAVVLAMEKEEKSFPMVDKVEMGILVKVQMEDLAAELDPTQAQAVAVDIPAVAQDLGPTLVMAAAAVPLLKTLLAIPH